MRSWSLAILALLVADLATAAPVAPSNAGRCVFTRTAGAPWTGSCGALSGRHPTFAIVPEPSVTSGRWRLDRTPVSAWAGQMAEPGTRTTRVEIEAYQDGTGILRTMQGWYGLSNVRSTASTVRFDIDTARELPPGDLDRQIIVRAATILSTEAAWNRADNRDCPDGATSWSIYCAMRLATLQVTGGIHHRRPALELVREVVAERAAARDYDHALMDYNNDRSTRLDDVQSLFAEAERRIPAGAP